MKPHEWQSFWADYLRQEIEADTIMESCETDFNGARLSGSNPACEFRPKQMNASPRNAGNLMDTVKPIYLKTQKVGLVIGLMAVVFLPLILNVYLRVAILAFMMGLVIRLFMAFEGEAQTKLNSISEKLTAIASVFQTREPPRYADFADCKKPIERICIQALRTGQDLKLELQVVAAAFSWPYFRDQLLDWSRAFPGSKITFDIALVCSRTLEDWGADCWARRVESTAAEIRQLRVSAANLSNLSIRVYWYDRIPDNHGVLINGHHLFIGRTEWVGAVPELRVGTRPYTRLSADDRSGNDKIATFCSWMQRARLRDAELDKSKDDERPLAA
jgi:hypothetical protein